MKMTINIAKDFSKFPAGRFKSDGPFSGEHFRDDLLAPALQNNDYVEVILDKTMGYGSSFLEEAFGGLVRVYKYSKEVLHKKLKIIYEEDPIVISDIWQYIDEA